MQQGEAAIWPRRTRYLALHGTGLSHTSVLVLITATSTAMASDKKIDWVNAGLGTWTEQDGTSVPAVVDNRCDDVSFHPIL